MASSGQFINPASKTVSKKSVSALNASNVDFPIFLGEVIEVNYSQESTGVIKFRSKHNNKIAVEEITAAALPLLSNIKIYPVKGELVLIFYFGNAYYLPLNFLNDISNNGTPFKFYQNSPELEAEYSKIHLANKTFAIAPKDIPATTLYEGDIVYEGRFGQSIKFGSTVKFKNVPQNKYSISNLSENGDPITIIRNGVVESAEDIKLDGASIYLCSTQRINIDTNNNGFAGITDTWSTLNVNSEIYEVLLDDSNVVVDDETSQFQNNPGPITQNTSTITSQEYTPSNVDISTLPKLPGTYTAYKKGVPTGTVELYIIDGVPVTNKVAGPYLELKKAAEADGILLRLNSGFRANEDITMPDGTVKAGQDQLYAKYLKGGNLAAEPGYSNHQNGSALDIDVSDSITYKWLVQNAIKKGFIRSVQSEAWHWEFIPDASSIYAKVPKSSPSWKGYNDGMV